MSRFEKINEKVVELKNVLDEINSKRMYWEAETKPKLINLITFIKQNSMLKCNLQVFDEGKRNSESIQLVIPPYPSGVFKVTEGEDGVTASRELIKEEAYIAFSQSYNGDIAIFMELPYINHLIEEGNQIFIGLFEPQVIDDAFILDKILDFLDRIILWEKNKDQRKGFTI
jgi:hypothetical protein